MTYTNIEISANKTALPTIVYFSDDHSHSAECTDRVNNQVPCNFKFSSSWSELAGFLESGEQTVAFHIKMIKKSHSSIAEFLDAIRLLCRYMPISVFLKIVVIIDDTTTRKEVEQLQKNKAFGLLLDINCYSIDEVCAAITSVLSKKSYWPNHIIDQLPNPISNPIHIYFREDWRTYITPAMLQKFHDRLTVTPIFCQSWDELGKMIECSPHQIAMHIDTIKRLDATIPEIISMLETRLKLAGLNIPIAVAIEPDTSPNIIKELKKCEISGIIPSAAGWGIDETVSAIDALTNRTQHWPKHIINQLPGNKPAMENKKSGINVTPRQSQVLDLVCNRGLSNKQIAKSLSISESTVKIHIGCILKEYGVRNRTQLVLAASSLLKA